MKKVSRISIITALYFLTFLAFPLSISFTEIALGMLFLITVFSPGQSVRPMVRNPEFPYLFFSLYLFIPFISLINSPNISASLPWIRRHFFILVIPLVMVTVAPVARYWKKLLALFVAASTLASIYAILQVFFGKNLSKPFFLKGYYVFSTAFFSQSNTLAEVLTFGFFAALFAMWLARGQKIQIIASISVLLIIAGIISTRARTPLAVVLLLGGVLAARLFGKKALLVLCLALALGLTVNHFDKRIFWRFRQMTRHPGGDRIEIWHYGISAFQSHPVLGIGYGNFREFLKANISPDQQYLLRYNHAHCNVLEMAATTGLVGLAIFLLFWGRVGWDMFSEWRKTRDPVLQAVFLTLFTAFLAFHGEGLTECNLKDAEVVLPFYVMIGIFYALSGHLSLRKPNPQKRENHPL